MAQVSFVVFFFLLWLHWIRLSKDGTKHESEWRNDERHGPGCGYPGCGAENVFGAGTLGAACEVYGKSSGESLLYFMNSYRWWYFCGKGGIQSSLNL